VERSRNKQLKYIIGLLIQCGCRVSELLHAEWSHFDLDRRLWRVAQSKSGKARFVPLSQGALDLIAELPRYKDCPFLIPNPATMKPWVGIFMSWDTARKRSTVDLRIIDHDYIAERSRRPFDKDRKACSLPNVQPGRENILPQGFANMPCIGEDRHLGCQADSVLVESIVTEVGLDRA
jgi:integrase